MRPGAAGASAGGDEIPVPGPGPELPTLLSELGAEIQLLDRELHEVGLLAHQAATEAERHEGRRLKAEERVNGLEHDPGARPEELREAYAQLLSSSRRAMLFDAQQEVLEGKEKTLQRYRDRLASLRETLSLIDPATVRAAQSAGSAGVSPAGEAAVVGAGPARATTLVGLAGVDRRSADSAAILQAQEDLRRDIARQMHDGPAQSLANIALQSEIVERLVGRGDSRATEELQALRRMVQATLTQTKDFIFLVRPMVLDDLGLVPTLRRTAADRGGRSGVEVDLDSSGPDRRLAHEVESNLFRLLDDAITGYVQLRPMRVTVRLDWSETDLAATVRGHWGPAAGEAEAPAEDGARDLPPALAAMIEQKDSEERRILAATRSLPPARLQEMQDRAAVIGVSVVARERGQSLEIVAHFA